MKKEVGAEKSKSKREEAGDQGGRVLGHVD